MKKFLKAAAGVLCTCMMVIGMFPVSQAQANEAGGDYVIDDNSFDLDTYLESLGDATVVKVAADIAGIGNTVLPSQVKELKGWQQKTFFDEEGDKVRRLGNHIEGDMFTFASGSKAMVKNIQFRLPEKGITIPEGASVTFENCTFSKTIVNNGTAVFNNCTFENGKIENNGAVEYLNGTKEPENMGTEKPSHIRLSLTLREDTLSGAVKGAAFHENVGYELGGTNKDRAVLKVDVQPKDQGITAKAQDGILTVSGTPKMAGEYKIAVTAEAQGDTPVTKTVVLTVNEKLAISLEGELDCVTAGQSGYQDYLEVYVTEGNGEKISFYEYAQKNKDAKMEVSLSPSGSGMTASYLFDKIAVSGQPVKAGTYQVSAVLKDKGQSVESNQKELRIYTGNETLKEQFANITAGTDTWDIEPYEIAVSDDAVVPKNLKTVYGSHESGLYAIIGNNQAVGSDTLVIPAGCDVTFENVKFYSSIRIIVEKGGSLTLSDSVAYGAVIVNGGTFSMNNSSALTDTLTLNDGSTLYNAKIVSHGRYLTDGSDKADAKTVVIVNGNVSVKGENSIVADAGYGDVPGQDAVLVNGNLNVLMGSSLTAEGGGDYAPALNGGAGIVLNNGTISGEGKLTAKGGIGYGGLGGNGIQGEGKITVSELESAGGDSALWLGMQKKGGDALGERVIVTTENYTLTAGKGNPDGTAKVTLTEDPDAEKPSDNEEDGKTDQVTTEKEEAKKPQFEEKGEGNAIRKSVKTGDATSAGVYAAKAAVAVMAAVAFAGRKRR